MKTILLLALLWSCSKDTEENPPCPNGEYRSIFGLRGCCDIKHKYHVGATNLMGCFDYGMTRFLSRLDDKRKKRVKKALGTRQFKTTTSGTMLVNSGGDLATLKKKDKYHCTPYYPRGMPEGFTVVFLYVNGTIKATATTKKDAKIFKAIEKWLGRKIPNCKVLIERLP